MAQWLKEDTALMEDLHVPSAHVGQLKTTCNSSSRGISVTSMGICHYVNISPHIHII